jgi:hypothetical protein
MLGFFNILHNTLRCSRFAEICFSLLILRNTEPLFSLENGYGFVLVAELLLPTPDSAPVGFLKKLLKSKTAIIKNNKATPPTAIVVLEKKAGASFKDLSFGVAVLSPLVFISSAIDFSFFQSNFSAKVVPREKLHKTKFSSFFCIRINRNRV